MTSNDMAAPLPGLVDPLPLVTSKGGWLRYAGPTASLLILIAVAYQLRTIDLGSLVALLPSAPAFWICFAAYYLAGPLSELVIFRRLWSLPMSGIVPLLRKLVSNELLLGYLGELYFYAWARRNAHITTAPFGAVKDVAILSAIVGNISCLLMVALAWPLLGAVHFGIGTELLATSVCVVLCPSLAAMVFRRRLFTLPRNELLRISGIHVVRILATMILAGIMWHILLPSVALGWWLVLAAVRQILSRLPLIPNKDVAFAGITAILVGGEGQIATAMTLMASLLLLAHLCVGTVLSTTQLAEDTVR